MRPPATACAPACVNGVADACSELREGCAGVEAVVGLLVVARVIAAVLQFVALQAPEVPSA